LVGRQPGEDVKMVERTTQTSMEEFEGKVIEVTLEKNTFNDAESDQYHIQMEPTTLQIKGKTGHLHEWLRLSAKTTQTQIPEGSVVERYLSQVELCISDARKAKTLNEALNMMKGKTFLFKKVKLGRSYEGKPAREVWTPIKLVK
jgi:hypothetical protein